MKNSEQRTSYPELRWLDTTAEILDNRFRIPGTNIRFGLDSIIGLFPYVGDVFTFFCRGLPHHCHV